LLNGDSYLKANLYYGTMGVVRLLVFKAGALTIHCLIILSQYKQPTDFL